jgi:hypothetical protein
MSKTDLAALRDCPDCGVAPGGSHKMGCDVERCPGCGWQRIQCDSEDHQLMPDGPWDGVWPGVEECQEYGWYVRVNPPGVTPCFQPATVEEADHQDVTEDLNTLGREAALGHLVWDRELVRWVRA